MTKADERALAYAKSHAAYLGYDYDQTYDAVKYGYLQAEKDLALTWEDVKKINDLFMEVATYFSMIRRNKYILKQPFYEEVAKRFNEQRQK